MKKKPAVTELAEETRDWLIKMLDQILKDTSDVGRAKEIRFAQDRALKRRRSFRFVRNDVAYCVDVKVQHSHWQELKCPMCDDCDGTGRLGRKKCEVCAGTGWKNAKT